MAEAYPAFDLKNNRTPGSGSGPMGGPGPFAPGNTPIVYARGSDPVQAFMANLSAAGVAGINSEGIPVGSTGGTTFMWSDQVKAANEAAGGDVMGSMGRMNNQFLQPRQAQQPAPMAGNAFLNPTTDVRVNGLTPAAPGGTPLVGRDYGSVNAAPGASGASSSLPPTPLSTFGQRLLATGGTETRDGAVFSGAGGKLSITQDPSTVPARGAGRPGAAQFDPIAVARYQQALAAGGDVAQTLQAFRTEVPKDVQLSEQELAALAMDDMRINQQAMEVAKYVNDRGMMVTANQPQSVRENRMAYIGGLASQAAPAAGGAADIRARLNQRPMRTVKMENGNEVVTYDANSMKELARAPRTAAPAGMRYNAQGELEAIPGSDQAVERQKAAKAESTKNMQAVEKANIVIQAVDEVMPKIGYNTAGFFGAQASFIPGTDAYDVGSAIDTIKANIGFDQLAAMRAASPTGGALGQVAVQELNFLQATLGNLKQGQSPDKLRDNLYKVQYHYQRWKDTMQGINPDEKAGPKPLTPEQYKRLAELKAADAKATANQTQ